MDYNKIAKEIIQNVGGKENINNLTHCFTRLRFELKDKDIVNVDKINSIEGVISSVYSGGQYQVVIGNKVEKVFNEAVTELGEIKITETKKSFKDSILPFITQVFTPLVPAIAAAGLIKGLLTAAKLLMKNNYGVDISTSSTYILLFAASQIIFYFMPIFLAYTTAAALKVDKIIAMVLGGFLVYPQVDKIMSDYTVPTKIFGLPFIKGAWGDGKTLKVFSYVESVIPIILTVLVLYYLEKLLRKYVPQVLQIILVPGLSLIIMLPIMLSVTGPIGIYVGNFIQYVYNAIIAFSPVLGGALIGGGWAIFVIFGAHRALLPIGLNDVALTGKQNLLAFAGAANFAQGGAVLGVALKTENEELKGVSWSALISAVLVGITEPAIYGANLRLKKPMIAAVISGALGGAIMGFGNVFGDAFANNGILTIFTYAAFGMSPFIYYIVGCLVAFFGATILTMILGFEDIPSNTHVDDINNGISNVNTSNLNNNNIDNNNSIDNNNKNRNKNIEIKAPVKGNYVEISKVNDPTFAQNFLGEGFAIKPENGDVFAPCDAKVEAIFPTNHAFGLKLQNGMDLLVHLGINTVELNGEHFESLVKVGDIVKQGQQIAKFDKEQIEKKNYDTTVITIITNNDEYKYKAITNLNNISLNDKIFEK